MVLIENKNYPQEQRYKVRHFQNETISAEKMLPEIASLYNELVTTGDFT